ncbi:exosortase R [Microbacterium testaceum]|uniref:exosortase R n=1 Tax=Microbacterium testaceum TaxID=2033 RepID=UPI002AC3E50C|nr:exosortase R [Microbacterium testaceum]MDZ5145664.1 exosortase R [Microbacterium testaceum]
MSSGVDTVERLRSRPAREVPSLDTNAAPPAQAPHAHKLVRFVAGAILILGGVAIIAAQTPIRTFEALIATWLADLTYAQDARFTTSAGQPSVGFLMRDHWMVLRVTVQCAIAFYAGALAILGGVLGISSRIKIARIALATITGIVGLTALNQLRLLVIGFAWGTWGRTGFAWAHGPIGTSIMLIGMAGALAVFFLIAVRKRAGAASRLRSSPRSPQ